MFELCSNPSQALKNYLGYGTKLSKVNAKFAMHSRALSKKIVISRSDLKKGSAASDAFGQSLGAASKVNAGRILSEIALYLLKPTVIALLNGMGPLKFVFEAQREMTK